MRATIVPMETWGLVAVIAGAGVAVAAIVVAIVVALRGQREADAPTDVVPGRAPFTAGPGGAILLQRLGMTGLVKQATGVVTWQVGERSAVAARTDGRGWATQRKDGWSTTSTVSGVTYTLVALQLPAELPTINVLRDGVIGSHVDVESSAFNQARDIRTDDDRVAHAVLTPRVIAMLHDLPEDLTVQVVGDHLVTFRRGIPRADDVLERASLLAEIAAAIPAFVYDGFSD